MGTFSHDISSTEHNSFRGGRQTFTKGPTPAANRMREEQEKSTEQKQKDKEREQLREKVRSFRRSRFREEGLDTLEIEKVDVKKLGLVEDTPAGEGSSQTSKTETRESRYGNDREEDFAAGGGVGLGKGGSSSKRIMSWGLRRPTMSQTSNAPPSSFSSVPRFALLAFLIAVVVPGFGYKGAGTDVVNINGADAGVIREAELVENGSFIEGRADSPTGSYHFKWPDREYLEYEDLIHIFTRTRIDHLADNNLLTLDLTKSWQTSSPSLTGLTQPSGPPAVAMGSLWHTYDALFLYGGEFSDSPPTTPSAVSTWKYDISSGSWTEYSNPQTSAGNNSDPAPASVNRAAEGAGLSVPEIGRSWYFGGHLDLYTTSGWSNQIARVYLKGLLEFTHPGYANDGVESLGLTKGAGDGGVYRNITDGGLQESAGFTERADGVLVYVPGWGVDGILLGLAGGTNETMTEMSIIDVYDIASSTWYKQSTTGNSPPIRVNPCAVVAAAPDGSSFNIYLYGGQNLIPYGEQTQYSDMWILTVPSFTWIEVNTTSSQSQPAARAGHTCNLMDGQMVVVGGYVGKDISCDSPGIYVFNASSLEWVQSFTALSSSSSSSSSSSGSGSGSGSGGNSGQFSEITAGSIGYTVPDIVQSVIGGSSLGGATATTPAAGSATAGPLATGKPPTFTVTQSPTTVVQTSTSTSTSISRGKKETNIAAIVAGTIAAALGILAGYLGFCLWLYRKQLKLYKEHVAMAQRGAWNPVGKMYRSSDSSNREKAGGAEFVVGPFGTPAGVKTASVHSEGGTITSVPTNTAGAHDVWAYGGGVMPGANSYGGGRNYRRISEEDSGSAEGRGSMGTWGREGPNTSGSGTGTGTSGNSSVDDLLGGQEPSFFSVVLNPRRTLRVVNSD
ncbi:kelch domain-containing protein [Rutstroemia sp. NJR-2017a BBW]|nr:kelch domain-containing protein [Rutstroemia sp. NJR-2017a BBW]